MKISCILVHYHTPELLKRAVSAIEKDASTSGLDVEIIVVDNGSREEDLHLLSSLSVKLIKPGENLGYAGGVNLGVKNSGSDVFILMNPDVEVLPGCIGALVKALQEGASAAGPRFYMDHGKEMIHHPLMWLNRRNELIWRTSVLSTGQAKRVRNQWRKHAKKQWLANSPVLNYNLTGALLAVTRKAWKEVGPFDEIFKLYFEEADWLKRLQKKRLKAYYVPGSEAVHHSSQSTSKEPKAKRWFSDSASIFRKRYYGLVFTAFLEHVIPALRCLVGIKEETDVIENPTVQPSINLSEFYTVQDRPLWIEISVNPLGIPALCVPIRNPRLEKWVFPSDSWEALEPGKYYFRLVDNNGRELESRVFLRSVAD
jgi:GT2 family glycosyltransferase